MATKTVQQVKQEIKEFIQKPVPRLNKIGPGRRKNDPVDDRQPNYYETKMRLREELRSTWQSEVCPELAAELNIIEEKERKIEQLQEDNENELMAVLEQIKVMEQKVRDLEQKKYTLRDEQREISREGYPITKKIDEKYKADEECKVLLGYLSRDKRVKLSED